jgi:site-specific recombinase XerD
VKPPPHALAKALEARLRLLATTLRPSTAAQYRYTVRLFLAFLDEVFPDARRPSDLKRDPHILGWLEHLWMRRARGSGRPLSNVARAGHLIRLRKLFDWMADHASPPRPGLLWSEDIPKPDDVLPRPLTLEDDARLQAELRRRNDLLSNALLLTRLTGMRIGETADLAADCLRHIGGEHWALHVPLGKLHNERWTPVDAEARAIVARLRFLATLGPGAAVDRLLPRRSGAAGLCQQMRAALQQAARAAGIAAHVVPHQLRHTYATTMLRAGISMPALMKLLGHRTANMTLRYVQVTQQDLQREFHLARQHPRYLLPLPPAASRPDLDAADAAAVMDCISAAIRTLDLFRQTTGGVDKPLRLLLRRLVRVRSQFEKLAAGDKNRK